MNLRGDLLFVPQRWELVPLEFEGHGAVGCGQHLVAIGVDLGLIGITRILEPYEAIVAQLALLALRYLAALDLAVALHEDLLELLLRESWIQPRHAKIALVLRVVRLAAHLASEVGVRVCEVGGAPGEAGHAGWRLAHGALVVLTQVRQFVGFDEVYFEFEEAELVAVHFKMLEFLVELPFLTWRVK